MTRRDARRILKQLLFNVHEENKNLVMYFYYQSFLSCLPIEIKKPIYIAIERKKNSKSLRSFHLTHLILQKNHIMVIPSCCLFFSVVFSFLWILFYIYYLNLSGKRKTEIIKVKSR